MKAKFLIGFAPLLVTAAFAVAPAAAQARVPCWENTKEGPCIKGKEGMKATSGFLEIKDSQSGSPLLGVTYTCTKNTVTGTVTNEPSDGMSSIPTGDASFAACSINVPKCTVTWNQLSEWKDQTDGEAGKSATYSDAITVPSGEGSLVVTGAECEVAGTYPFAGTMGGSWVNDNPSTLTFSAASGFFLGTDSMSWTGTFKFTRANGTNIFLG